MRFLLLITLSAYAAAQMLLPIVGGGVTWAHRSSITIQTGQITTSQSNAPLPFQETVTAADIKHTASVNGQTVPTDYVFGLDAQCSNRLSWEIESFNAGTGAITGWVKWPTAQDGSVIYRCYGSNSVVAWAGNVTGTWSSYGATGGVWHMNNNPAGGAPQILDSTAQAGDGTVAGGVTSSTGVYGDALTFDGTSGTISIGTNSRYQLGGQFTIEVFAKPTLTAATSFLVAKTGTGGFSYGLGTAGGATGKWELYLDFNNASPYDIFPSSTTTASTSRWDYLTVRSDTTNKVSAPIMSPEITHGCAVVYSGKIYSFGGHPNNVGSPTRATNIFDPAVGGGTWTTGAQIPVRGRWGCAAVLVGTDVYVMGGFGPSAAVTQNSVYHIGSDTWTDLGGGAVVPTAIGNQGITAALVGTTIYAMYNGDLWAYDTVGQTWTDKTNPASNPGTWASAVSDGTYVYFFDGNSLLGKVKRYDPSGDSWSDVGTTPYTAWAGEAIWDGSNKIYYGYGRPANTGAAMERRLYYYSISGGTFTQLASDSAEGDAFSYGLISGKIYTFGYRTLGAGQNLQAGYASIYNISTDLFETSAPQVELWVNGVKEANSAMLVGPFASGNALAFGSQNPVASYFKGAIDEIRITNSARPTGWAEVVQSSRTQASFYTVAAAP